MKRWLSVVILCCCVTVVSSELLAEPVDPVDPNERCAVCGMMVAKYNPWITQLHSDGEKPAMFDGVKDMMAYYFNPEAYGGKGDMSAAALWVKDYYTLIWLDGRAAFYVVGSDVMGPMGEELVPFDSLKAAENFVKDHKGTKVLRFEELDTEMIMAMKKKHMMKMKKKGMKK